MQLRNRSVSQPAEKAKRRPKKATEKKSTAPESPEVTGSQIQEEESDVEAVDLRADDSIPEQPKEVADGEEVDEKLNHEAAGKLHEEEESEHDHEVSESNPNEDRAGDDASITAEADDEEPMNSDVEMEVETNGQNLTQSLDKGTVQRVERRKELRGHRLPLTCICVDSSDKYVYTASKDGSIIKWCLSTKKLIERVDSIRKKEAESSKKFGESCHVNHINAIAISDDSKFLATGGWDKKVRIWSPEDLQWLHTFTLHRQEVTALAFRRGHHMLYSGSADRSVMLWTLEDDENRCFVETLIGHESPITSMDTTRRERVLTSGGRDQSIRIWKIVEQAQTVFQSKHQSVDVARFVNDQLFVSGGEDGNLTLWTTMKRSPLCSIRAHEKDEKSNLNHWVTSLATFLMRQAKQVTKAAKSKSTSRPSKRRKLDESVDGLKNDDNEDEDADSNDEDEGHDRAESEEENMIVDRSEQSDSAVALIASGSCDSNLHIWRLLKNNTIELHQTIECPGYINDLRFTSDGSRVVAACGKEHRFGRWTVLKGGRNRWRVFDVNKL